MEIAASKLAAKDSVVTKTAIDDSLSSTNKEESSKSTQNTTANEPVKQLEHSDNVRLLAKEENKALSDKEFKEQKGDVHINGKEDQSLNKVFFKLIHKVEGLSTYLALASNLLGSATMQLNISDALKKRLAGIVDILTNLSFIPYGLDGIRIGAEKKNPYQTFGYLLELTTVWLSNLKTKYLIRGAGTGTDQIWVATDQKLKVLRNIDEGRFHNWYEGLIEVPKACLELLREVAKDPIGTIFTTNSKGHKALLSSIADIIATLGFAFTGKEKIFGPIRDFGGMLFDIEMLFQEKMIAKLAGGLFIAESSFDYLARFAKNEWARLTLNMISHSAGRAALMCYKNSDPNANRDHESILEFKKATEPISKLKNEKKAKTPNLNVLSI